MFKFGKAALYERMLREKDRHIDILAEQIDYLRTRIAGLEGVATPMIGTSLHSRPDTDDIPLELKAANVEVKQHLSDEEIDAMALLEAGHITKDQLGDVFEAFGLTPELEFDSHS